MPISGLVVSFDDDPELRSNAIDAISRNDSIETGDTNGFRMAIVTETDSKQKDRQLWQWLGELPGVIHIDVAMVGFECDTDVDADAPCMAQED